MLYGRFLHFSFAISYKLNENIVCCRFLGKGTVSPMGYRHPSLINVHFIVFDENKFGVLWIDLHSFSLFSRVEETFPALR
jgi:hypothetical protein